MATVESLPIRCETKGEISAFTTIEGSSNPDNGKTHEMSSIEGIFKMDACQLESTRGIKRALIGGTGDTTTVQELIGQHVGEGSEPIQTTPMEGGSPSEEDDCGPSNRKKRRVMSTDGLAASRDSEKQSTLVASSSSDLLTPCSSAYFDTLS